MQACDSEVEKCDNTEFLQPYISPYYDDVVQYDKKIATYVSEGYCAGQCGDSSHRSFHSLIDNSELLTRKLRTTNCLTTLYCSNQHSPLVSK